MKTEDDKNGGDRPDKEAGELMSRFRRKFIFGQNRASGPLNVCETAETDPAKYEQPPVTKDVRAKIERLHRITSSIEKNLIEPSDFDPGRKNFNIDYEGNLNTMQLAAATATEGPLLVIAGAGSGKTRTIVYRVAYLLENDIPPGKILLLTFTRKAAKQMLSGTSALLNDKRGQQVMGGTFHSFANHLLRKYCNLLGITPNFTIIDTVDSADVIDFIRREMGFSRKRRPFPRKARIQSIISKSRNCSISVKEVIHREFSGLKNFTDDIEILRELYSEYKKKQALFDYDDLLEALRDQLKDNTEFKKRVQDGFHYIMVDEFQDTNVVQKQIVDLIAQKKRNIMVVGDDSQSIYAFRGANFENILRFPETYPDCKYARIEQNYRSSQNILDFTNSVIEKASIGYKKRLYSTKGAREKPVVRKFYGQQDEAEFIAGKILELREKEIPLNEIAVLYRASYQGSYVQAELLKRKIPYVVYGGIKFAERRHVKDIIAYLRIALNPFDPVAWNRILKLIPRVGDVTAGKIISHIQESGGNIDFTPFSGCKYSSDLADLQSVLTLLSEEGPALWEKIEILKKYYKPVLKAIETDCETRLPDIDVLRTLAMKYNDMQRFLSDFALDPPSSRYQDKTTPLVDETEDTAVVLSTVHSAKGLEWNTVFIIHLLDGLFPAEKSIKDIEELEEERRLFYVAGTRTKERLYLTMPSFINSMGGFFTLPSRFLAEIDKRQYKLK